MVGFQEMPHQTYICIVSSIPNFIRLLRVINTLSIEETGGESRETSQLKTKVLQFMLEAPSPYTILFLFKNCD